MIAWKRKARMAVGAVIKRKRRKRKRSVAVQIKKTPS
jgi:hypothetical protein